MPRKLPGVDETPTFFRVRFRMPYPFITCRVPEWARKASQSVSKGSKVVTCKDAKGEWKVQSVMIRKGYGKTKPDAMRLAKAIVNKIEK